MGLTNPSLSATVSREGDEIYMKQLPEDIAWDRARQLTQLDEAMLSTDLTERFLPSYSSSAEASEVK